MVRRDIVHSERCPFAHLGASTSQIGLEITEFAIVAPKGDCCDAFCGIKPELCTFKNTHKYVFLICSHWNRNCLGAKSL